MIKNFTLGLLLMLTAGVPTLAQERADGRAGAAGPAVTISVSAKGVRFAAIGAVKQTRLEVFAEGGDAVYSSDFQPGNVRDWRPEDRQGQRLADGRYLCVVTFRDLSGRLGMKQGTLVMQGGRPSLEMAEVEQSGAAEPEKALAAVGGEAAAEAVTVTAHDGQQGQLVSTRGGLSFRAGDFFSAKDRELMRLTPEGNLGVGVPEPRARLDVDGTIRASKGIVFADGSVQTTGTGGRLDADGSVAAAAVGVGTQGLLARWMDGAGTLGNSSVAESGGNVGIGTASPLYPLHVTRPTFGQVFVSGGSAADFLMHRTGAPANARLTGFRSQNGKGRISSFNDAGTYRVENILTWDNATGNVGIGTASPLYPLHVVNPTFGQALVSGGTAADLLLYHSNAPSNTRRVGLRSQNGKGRISSFLDSGEYRLENILTWDNATGSVGVGTAAPSNVLEVRKDQPFAGTPGSMTQLVVRNDSPTGFSAVSIWGNGAERGRYQYNSASPNLFLTSIGQVPFYFGTNGAVRMSVDAATGNVGIGTGFTPATQRLEVSGNMHVTGNAVVDGNIAAKYQDVAEWVPASGDVRAGTVVMLDVTRSNAVTPSARPYDTRVAGVVSAQPGLILGEGGEGKVLVATTGRVKVRVDARRRAVRVGDLLVTSDRPGVAMRSVPVRAGGALLHRPGTIIGKALEPLAGGEGEILVLLSLQ